MLPSEVGLELFEGMHHLGVVLVPSDFETDGTNINTWSTSRPKLEQNGSSVESFDLISQNIQAQFLLVKAMEVLMDPPRHPQASYLCP